jgi:hypothetical protein
VHWIILHAICIACCCLTGGHLLAAELPPPSQLFFLCNVACCCTVIGRNFKVKINANIGNSAVSSSIEEVRVLGALLQ